MTSENMLAHFTTEQLQEVKEDFEHQERYAQSRVDYYRQKLAVVAMELQRREDG